MGWKRYNGIVHRVWKSIFTSAEFNWLYVYLQHAKRKHHKTDAATVDYISMHG